MAKPTPMRSIAQASLLIILSATVATAVAVVGVDAESPRFEDPADFPLMGDWEGSLIRPEVAPDKNTLAAQLICVDKTNYRLRILPALYHRAEPMLEVDVVDKDGRIVYQSQGWDLVFENGRCKGVRDPQGDPVKFELHKVQKLSPTLGQKPPAGARVLFDGTNFDAWQTHGTQTPPTWTLLKEDGAMETVSGHWYNMGNRKKGIGGSIVTRKSFKSMQFHMEFRYPVEPGLVGQKRGNSGLTFSGFEEIQILNSYGLPGYWNECGALYHYLPPKVNAAAPPLQWQTYDVEIQLPRPDSGDTTGIMTVRHNGRLIHHQVPMTVGKRESVTIALQDHRNRLQFRNIWVKEID